MPAIAEPDYFDRLATELAVAGPAEMHADEIGHGMEIETPAGRRRLLYADHIASGRALGRIETAVLRDVLPYYANSHTRASFCGAAMTAARTHARAFIARQMNAGPDHAVIFCGSGATAGINRLVHLFGLRQAVAQGRHVTVLIGPWEHHSNILPWRESGAEVIELPEGPGGPCQQALQAALQERPGALIVGAFSAASNVTGAIADVPRITAILKRNGALSVWDYAGGAPYLPINLAEQGIDAIAVSPHKFPGGPGASGILCVRRDTCRAQVPTFPGGGTVRFAAPERHTYSLDVSSREEGGTPNVVGDLRAAMAFAIKSALGTDWLARRHAVLVDLALTRLTKSPGIELLPVPEGPRLPIFSLRLRDSRGALIHHQLATRLLSDHFGVQARGGCACAGPYVHRLLGINEADSLDIEARIAAGDEFARPGFLRFNLSALLSENETCRILDAICDLPRLAETEASAYRGDVANAVFLPVSPVRNIVETAGSALIQ